MERRRCQFLSSSSSSSPPKKKKQQNHPLILASDSAKLISGRQKREKGRETCGDFRGCSLKLEESAALGEAGAETGWSCRRSSPAIRSTNAAVASSMTHSYFNGNITPLFPIGCSRFPDTKCFIRVAIGAKFPPAWRLSSRATPLGFN